MPLHFWRTWQAERALRRKAGNYIRSLQREPADGDVAWLAAHGTGGDDDHARWELRYARRALGLLAAARDALDDRTASAVARELTASLARDPNIAASMLPVAERQFNARLRAYGDALHTRDRLHPPRRRLGVTLLAFANPGGRVPDEVVEHAGALLATYLADANAALRREFGAAALPDNVAPSAVIAGRNP